MDKKGHRGLRKNWQQAPLARLLARLAKGGVIVELGCGKGVLLNHLYKGTQEGAKLPVYGIDPYQPYVGAAAGGIYGPKTREALLRNLKAFGMEGRVSIIQERAEDVAPSWTRPVALLWVDTGQPYDELAPILEAWQKHIVWHGLIGISALWYDKRVHVSRLPDFLRPFGFRRRLCQQRHVVVLWREAGSDSTKD